MNTTSYNFYEFEHQCADYDWFERSEVELRIFSVLAYLRNLFHLFSFLYNATRSLSYTTIISYISSHYWPILDALIRLYQSPIYPGNMVVKYESFWTRNWYHESLKSCIFIEIDEPYVLVQQAFFIVMIFYYTAMTKLYTSHILTKKHSNLSLH